MNDKNKDRDLIKALTEAGAISRAQADLVCQDHEVTGMPLEDILIARGWVDETALKKHAPWLFESIGEDGAVARSYQDNLKRYRAIMAEILGESSE
ncbi:MAG: hypothetical protein KC777_04150 [Cyanobacteria bacterium HKST-UBA02]|nr:hypothetical protein [Cyanobacteria bacterium HKST-UBA02]